MKTERQTKRDSNRDPLTGAPGSHPVGTGIGAAAGGMAAGAAAGTVAGPVGTMVGAAAGAIVGGLAGKAMGEMADPTVEDAYWRKNYTREPYYQSNSGLTYDDYGPAYRTGYTGRSQYPDRDFDEVVRDLEASYIRAAGTSKLGWEKAKHATRAAWDRVERAIPGDADRDGK
ncbi:MAG TPA: hypothetical protein VJT81_15015 [Burkholderiales bacterium]|nr:hypothetical protein [Burkholderiales bacterium]